MHLFLLILFLAVCIIYYSKICFRTWVNPVAIFFMPWLLLLLLFELRVYSINEPSFEIVYVVLLSFAMFVIGFEIFLFNRKPQQKPVDFNRLIDMNKRRLQWMIIGLTAVSVAANLIMLMRLIEAEGSIARIIATAALVRTKMVKGELDVVSVYGYFASVSLAAIILSGVYATRYGIFKLYSLVSFIPILIFSFIYMGRSELIWAVLLYFNVYLLAYYITGRKLFTKKRMIVYGLLMVAMIYLINIVSFFRGGGQILLHYKEYLRYEEPDNSLMRILYSNYIYVVSPLPALDVFLEQSDSPLIMGGKSFRPLIFFAEAKHKNPYYPFVRIPIPVNVYTYLGDAYMDFGMAGLILIPFVLGVGSAVWYRRFLLKPDIFHLAVLVILFTQLEYSIFYSMLASGNVWISIFALILLRYFFKTGEPDAHPQNIPAK